MSYCVNCGVELDATARACPLCHTPVQNPNRPVDAELPPPFPSRRKEVQPASKKELALLISAMFASVAVLCGVLNLFFLHSGRPWSRRSFCGGCPCGCGCCWTPARWGYMSI